MHDSTDPPEQTLYFIAHTHWEGAVFKTREQYLRMGLPHILHALQLLEEHPEYRFTLDQACYVEPFLARYPQEAERLRRFVRDGRLEIAGGLDVMLDVNMPGGESFARQVLYGKGFFRRELGVDVTSGWQLDTFGHHAQMPQLLRLAGYRSQWFFRGVANWDVPAEFVWEGIDGSRIDAYWLPHGYAIVYGSPADPQGFTDSMVERFEQLSPSARGAERVGLAGADVCVPEDHVTGLVEWFNEQVDRPFQLRLAVPSEYEAAVAQRAEPGPVIRGELNPIFQGTYSSRIELKQWTREIEGSLTTAETLGVLLDWLDERPDVQRLWQAWEPALFNQAHDLMSGVMTDHVYEDTVRSFCFSRRIAGDEVETRLGRLAECVDTRGAGIPLVVFNPLGWDRTDLAEADVGLTQKGISALRLLDSDGQPVPVQIREARRYPDGGLHQVRLAFIADDVPALGHAVYHLEGLSGAPEDGDAAASADAVLENEHFRVEVDPATGAISSLVMRDSGWETLSAPANVVLREEDRGDLWEPYRPLNGGSRIAMKEPHPVSPQAIRVGVPPRTTPRVTVERGPVVSSVTVENSDDPAGFRTTVQLAAGSRRIRVRTTLRNEERFVRYRAAFPVAIEGGCSVHEIPFGAMERPNSIEFPAQNWIDYGDGERGVALLNCGLPGNNVVDGTMLLSLMRCTSIVAYGFGGGYEPGMTSDSGFELGAERTFDYALAPHAGDWRSARVYRQGMELNRPLMVRPAAVHAGALPTRWGLLQVTDPRVVVSALKPGEQGGSVLRVYEATGAGAPDVSVKLNVPVRAAQEVDLMEDPLGDLAVVDGAVQFDLTPFQIRTIRLVLR